MESLMIPNRCNSDQFSDYYLSQNAVLSLWIMHLPLEKFLKEKVSSTSRNLSILEPCISLGY